MSKYKVGDKVKVREDLVGGKIYEGQSAVSDMVEFKGKEVTIERTSCSGNDGYRIKELGYTWTNEMFEGLTTNEINIPKFNIGDKVELSSVDKYDKAYNLKIGDRGTVSELINRSCCIVTFPSILSKFLYCEQIKLVDEDFVEEPSPTPKGFVSKTKEVSPKYVRCIDDMEAEDALELDKIYKVLGVYEDGYMLDTVTCKGYLWFKFRFVNADSPIEPDITEETAQSIPNKGTIKYRTTEDGITYTTLNGHNSGKSVKSGKDEADNKIGILIATARSLGFDEDKISGIVDVLFDNDSYDSKSKCDNAIMKNDIARALSILDRYKEE